MGTHSIKWINEGAVFEISPKSPSPRAQRQALLEKAHVLREEMKGTRDLPESVIREIVRELEPFIFVRMMNVLLHDALSRVDPAVAKMTPDAVQENLSSEEYEALVSDLLPKAASSKEDKRPLDGKALSTTPNA